MAKRYIEFADLFAGEFKPAGTLGRHHCTVVPKSDGRKAVHGSVKGRVDIGPGDTLGYDSGEVWKVPKPSAYKDPIRRILAENKISQKILIETAEPVTAIGGLDSFYPGSAHDRSRGEVLFASMGETTRTTVNSWPVDWAILENKEMRPGRESLAEYKGGEVLVFDKVAKYEAVTLRQPRRISRVVVRPGVDRAAAAAWLAETFARWRG